MLSHAEIEGFLSRFEERVEPVERAVKEAWWDLATAGTEDAQNELVRAGMEYNRFFADKDEYEKVTGFYEERDALEDNLLRRQVEVLYRTFAGRQGDEGVLERIEELEARANAVYGNHRGLVVGENEIREILRSSEDETLRREAWEAAKTVGREVEGAAVYLCCVSLVQDATARGILRTILGVRLSVVGLLVGLPLLGAGLRPVTFAALMFAVLVALVAFEVSRNLRPDAPSSA